MVYYWELGLGFWCLTTIFQFMVFNATFNNISVISWQSVLLVEETGVPWETTDLLQITDKLYHIMLYQVHLTWARFKLTTLVVIGTDCIGSYKFNYHTITTTSAPYFYWARLGQLILFDDYFIWFWCQPSGLWEILPWSNFL